MANLDLIKENVELQIQIGRGSNIAEPIKEEYLISDTLPDVSRILSVDVDRKITRAEVQDNRVAIEADVKFSIIYLSEDEEGTSVNTAVYNNKLSNFIDILGAEQGMFCNVECELEHINPTLVNERKINIEAIFNCSTEVFSQNEFNFVKSVDNRSDIQIIKKIETIDKCIFSGRKRISDKATIEVSMDKSEVNKIIKFDYLLHKKEARVLDGKIKYSCYINVDIIYKANDSRELFFLNKDIFVSDEEDIDVINSDQCIDFDFKVITANYDIRESDLGEKRIVDLNFDIEANSKVSKIEEIEVVEDAYSPERTLDLIKENGEFEIRLGSGNSESITKDNIKPDGDEPIHIISVTGKIVNIENNIVGSIINVNGILRVKCIYKSANVEIGYDNYEMDLPFTSSIEISGLNNSMNAKINATLENLEASIEAGTIAVKGVISFNAKATYKEKKEYIHSIEETDDVESKKKASVVIYVVQPNDTLWKLAKKYKTTMDSIAKVNSIDMNDEIHIGTKLIIPGRAII
ncbi:MAG: DUF3794 and LysM peptidoglycan-binding domain-containing protein [Sarcina sp.]